ncbi:MAG: DUF4136 domain-containing protein [Pseudomonadota bacterium]
MSKAIKIWEVHVSKLILATLLLTMLAACSSPGPRVSSSVDPDTDFTALKTYGFMPELGTDRPGGIRTPLGNMLINAVSKELQARGMRESDSPDVLVNFFVNVDQRLDVYRIPTTRSYYGYRYGRYRAWGGYETRVREYNQGTLSIDLIDPQRKMLVWEGVAQGRLSRNIVDDLTQEKVDNVVNAVMKELPR